MDTRYYGQNPALHPAKAIQVWLKMTPAIIDSKLRPEGGRYNESWLYVADYR